MKLSLLALALLATFVVQGAQETPSEAPGPALSVMAPNGSGSAFPVLRGASHGVPPPLPAAALPSTGAPVTVPAITPEPSGEVGTALLGGYATWFDACQDCAAAGPELRAFLGDWRGQTVRVDGPDGRWVRVRLTDWCACGDRHGTPTIIDLSRAAFSELADPSRGIVQVSIEWPQPAPTLPPTDVHPDDLRMMDEVRGDTLYEGGTE